MSYFGLPLDGARTHFYVMRQYGAGISIHY